MTTLLNHPVLLIFLFLSFMATTLVYLVPDFTSNNLVISGTVNIGTFCGTFVHMNWSHWIGNMIFLIPVWIYADKLTGKPFITIIVLANLLLTGIYGLLSGQRLCGLSGVVFMLIGLTAILGNWLMFGFAAVLFFSEFFLLGDGDNMSHGAHIIFFVVGIAIGLAKCAFAVF
jgi:GlpG protein